MMIKKVKKGFTLVELVVVIAVIAVLAAVSVIAYTSITRKANESHDQQIIDQINLSLKAEVEAGRKPETMHKALQVLDADGFAPAKFGDLHGTAKDYEFAYILKDCKFVILNKTSQEVVYPTDVQTPANKYEIWKFVDSVDSLSSVYSNYLKFDTLTGAPTITTGLDVGENTGISSITYQRSDTTGRDVVVRTNSYLTTLTVDAPHDTVRHYDKAGSVEVISTHESASYHENGTVPFVEVHGGHVVLEKTAIVSNVHFAANNSGEFKNDSNQKISVDMSQVSQTNMPEFSRDPVEIEENGTYVAEVKSGQGSSSGYIWLFGQGTTEQMVVTSSEGEIATNGTLKPGIESGAEAGSVADQIANAAIITEDGISYEPKTTKEEAMEAREAAISEEVIEEQDQSGNQKFAARIGETGYVSFDAGFVALQSGQTLVLLEDTTLDAKVKFNVSNVTLDLNGFKLITNYSGSSGNDRFGAFEIPKNTVVNIKDTRGTGLISAPNQNLVIQCYGKLNFFGGTVLSSHNADVEGRDMAALRVDNYENEITGVAYIYGGRFVSTTNDLYYFNFGINNCGKTYLYGGLFETTAIRDCSGGIANCGDLYVFDNVSTNGIYWTNRCDASVTSINVGEGKEFTINGILTVLGDGSAQMKISSTGSAKYVNEYEETINIYQTHANSNGVLKADFSEWYTNYPEE